MAEETPVTMRVISEGAKFIGSSMSGGQVTLSDDRTGAIPATAPDPQTQLTAMVLTMQSVRHGAQAQILLCGPAATLAVKDAPASATAPQQPIQKIEPAFANPPPTTGQRKRATSQLVHAERKLLSQVGAVSWPEGEIGLWGKLSGWQGSDACPQRARSS